MITLAEMAIQYKDILEGIFALLAEDWKACSVALCLASMQPDEDLPAFRVVELSPRLTEKFRDDIVIPFLADLHKKWLSTSLVLYNYDAASKPHIDEIEHLDFSMPEYEPIKKQIEPLQSLPDMGTFQEDERQFVSGLRFYVIRIQFSDDHDPVYFFRSYAAKNLLSKSRFLAAMWRDQDEYDVISKPVLLFDKHIDCMSRGSSMFIFHKENFHYLFRFLEEVMKTAKHTLNVIKVRVPIKNFAKFAHHCERHPQKMAKLKNISQKPYLKDLTIDKIQKVINRMNKEDLGEEFIKAINEERVLLYDEKKPWMLLKLLDDDYLWSEMTEIGYQIDGKRELS